MWVTILAKACRACRPRTNNVLGLILKLRDVGQRLGRLLWEQDIFVGSSPTIPTKFTMKNWVYYQSKSAWILGYYVNNNFEWSSKHSSEEELLKYAHSQIKAGLIATIEKMDQPFYASENIK
jgi:hypothetical protein